MLSKNSYPQVLVNKTTNLHLKSSEKIKTVGPEKLSITLLLPYVNKKARILEKNIIQVISNSYYYAKPRVIFLDQGAKIRYRNTNKVW